MVTGTHTSTWFYCFGSLAAPRLSTPFPALSESHHPADGHPSPSHEVVHPLIRPSTPFGQTSTHRSRKPAPCSPALSLALSPSHPPSFRSFHLRPRSTTLDPTHPHPRPFKLARIPRMHQLFLIVCLTRTHATATAGIRARITHTDTLSLTLSLSLPCTHARSRAIQRTYTCTRRYIRTCTCRMRTLVRAPTSVCTCTRLDVSIYDLS